MVLFSLNKTGILTTLVLQLLCSSLYPAFGRPLIEEDNIGVEQDPEEDEDQAVDDHDGSEYEDTDGYEQDKAQTPKQCRGLTGQELQTCMDKWKAEIDAWSKNASATVRPDSTSSKDE